MITWHNNIFDGIIDSTQFLWSNLLIGLGLVKSFLTRLPEKVMFLERICMFINLILSVTFAVGLFLTYL